MFGVAREERVAERLWVVTGGHGQTLPNRLARFDAGHSGRIAGALSDCIEKLAAAGFHGTADLVRLAKLDLLVRVHGIDDSELDALRLSLQAEEDVTL